MAIRSLGGGLVALVVLAGGALPLPAAAQVVLHAPGAAQGHVLTTSADGASIATQGARPYAAGQLIPRYSLGMGQTASGSSLVYDFGFQSFPNAALVFSATVDGTRLGADPNLPVTLEPTVANLLQAPGSVFSAIGLQQNEPALSATRLSANRYVLVFANPGAAVVTLIELVGSPDGSDLHARSAAVVTLEVSTNTALQIGAGWNGKWLAVGGRTQTIFISYDATTGIGGDRTVVTNPAGFQYLAAGPGSGPDSLFSVMVSGDEPATRTVSVFALATTAGGSFGPRLDPGLSVGTGEKLLAAFDFATSNLVLVAYGATTAVRVGTPQAAGLSFLSAVSPLGFLAASATPPVVLPPSSKAAYLLGAAAGLPGLFRVTMATGAIDLVPGAAFGSDQPPTLLWEAAPVPSVTLTLASGETGAIPVSLSNALSRVVTVGYRVTDGTNAVAGVDYRDCSPTPGTLTFASGQTHQNICLEALTRNCRAAGSFSAALTSNSAGPFVATPVPVTITADGCTASFSAVPALTQGGTGLLTVALSKIPVADVTVQYTLTDGTNAAAGRDYRDLTSGAGTLTFRAGQDISKSISLAALPINCRAAGSFRAAVTTNSSGAPGDPATVPIAADPCPATFSQIPFLIAGTVGRIVVSLPKVPDVDVTVGYLFVDGSNAAAGVDYQDQTSTPGSLIFRAGLDQTRTISLFAPPRGCRAASTFLASLTSNSGGSTPGQPVSVGIAAGSPAPVITLSTGGPTIPDGSAVPRGVRVTARIDTADPEAALIWSVDGALQPGPGTREITVPASVAGILEIAAVRASCPASRAEVRLAVLDETRKLILLSGKVEVQVVFKSPYDAAARGAAVPLPEGTSFGSFTFSDPSNPEVFAKALDFGTSYAVLSGTLTDFQVMTVFTVPETNERRVFRSAAGTYEGGGAQLASAAGPGGGAAPGTVLTQPSLTAPVAPAGPSPLAESASPEIRIYTDPAAGDPVEDADPYPAVALETGPGGLAPQVRRARVVNGPAVSAFEWVVVNGDPLTGTPAGDLRFEIRRAGIVTVRARADGLPAACPGVSGGCIEKKLVAVDDVNVLVLRGGDLTAQVSWQSQYDPERGGAAAALVRNASYGLFHFGDPKNPEVFAKGLDFGTSFPVLFAGLTDFECAVTFVRKGTGKRVTFYKAPGSFRGGGDSVTLVPPSP